MDIDVEFRQEPQFLSTTRIPVVGFRLILAWVTLLVVPSFGDAAFGMYISEFVMGMQPSVVVPVVTMVGSTLLCLWVLKPLLDERKHLDVNYSAGQRLIEVLKTFGKMFLVNLIINIVLQYVYQLVGQGGESVNQQTLEQISMVSKPMFILFAVIAGPITEELLFRGLIFRAILPKNRFWAYFISSALFGLIHLTTELLAGDVIGMLAILTYSSMGFFFAYVYEKTQDIKCAMLLHMMWNSMSVIFMFMS